MVKGVIQLEGLNCFEKAVTFFQKNLIKPHEKIIGQSHFFWAESISLNHYGIMLITVEIITTNEYSSTIEIIIGENMGGKYWFNKGRGKKMVLKIFKNIEEKLLSNEIVEIKRFIEKI